MSTPRTRRLALAGTAALAAIALLASCAGQSAATDDAAAGDPVEGGTLTYLEHQAHTTLYPPQAGFYPNGGIVNNITARLTWQDPESLEIEPWVATEWTVNADATEYTFDLRDDVTFSDGTPLDAAAVAKNFDTYGLGNKELGLTISEAINNYASSEVVDADTVTFHFSAPAPGFLQATSTINSGLLSPATLDRKLEDFGAGIVDRDRRLGPVRHHRGGDRHVAPPRGARGLRLGAAVVRAPGPRVPRRDRRGRDARGQRAHRLAARRAGRRHPLRAGVRRGAGDGRRLRGRRSADPRREQLARPAVHEPAAQRHPGAPGARARRRRAGGRRHDLHRELPGRHVGARRHREGLHRRVGRPRVRPRAVGGAPRRGRLDGRRRRHPREGRPAPLARRCTRPSRSRSRSRPSSS